MALAKLPAPVRTAAGAVLLFLAAIGPAYLIFAMLNKIIAISVRLYSEYTGVCCKCCFCFCILEIRGSNARRISCLSCWRPCEASYTRPLVLLLWQLCFLATNWDKLRAFAVTAWNAISAAVLYGASLVVRGIGLIITAIGFIIPAVRGRRDRLLSVWANSLKSSAGQALSSAKSVASSAVNAAKSTANAAKTATQAAGSQNAIADAGEKRR